MIARSFNRCQASDQLLVKISAFGQVPMICSTMPSDSWPVSRHREVNFIRVRLRNLSLDMTTTLSLGHLTKSPTTSMQIRPTLR
jgi:hypothetical protein